MSHELKYSPIDFFITLWTMLNMQNPYKQFGDKEKGMIFDAYFCGLLLIIIL